MDTVEQKAQEIYNIASSGKERPHCPFENISLMDARVLLEEITSLGRTLQNERAESE